VKTKQWASVVLVVYITILSGCEEKAMVNIYDKNILKNPPTCLSLSVIPEDQAMKNVLEKSYAFDLSCPYRLDVSYKNGIHCNSNQNSDRKALSAFPSSYLRMEIRRGMRLLYSYYIDLPQSASPEDVERGIKRIVKDIKKL
jgi:hypothetical protein